MEFNFLRALMGKYLFLSTDHSRGLPPLAEAGVARREHGSSQGRVNEDARPGEGCPHRAAHRRDGAESGREGDQRVREVGGGEKDCTWARYSATGTTSCGPGRPRISLCSVTMICEPRRWVRLTTRPRNKRRTGIGGPPVNGVEWRRTSRRE